MSPERSLLVDWVSFLALATRCASPNPVDEIHRQELPSLGEFIEACIKKHGCRVLEVQILGPRGLVTSRYLCRSNGRRWKAVLPEIDNEEPLTADVLSSLCNRIHLPTHLFGLFIG